MNNARIWIVDVRTVVETFPLYHIRKMFILIYFETVIRCLSHVCVIVLLGLKLRYRQISHDLIYI